MVGICQASLLGTEGEPQTHPGQEPMLRFRATAGEDQRKAVPLGGLGRTWVVLVRARGRLAAVSPKSSQEPLCSAQPALGCASKASTSLGSDHCGQGVKRSSQNRRVPLTGQETQLLPKNISCSEKAASLGPRCRSDPTPPESHLLTSRGAITMKPLTFF